MARGTRQTLEVGQKAPDFRLKSIDGGTFVLNEILANGPALLAFYKVSCPTCQLTLPFLNRLQGGGVQVFMVSQNPADLTVDFNQEFDLRLPALLDKASEGYPVSNAYGLSHVPSMFLVETDGSIGWSSVGFFKKDLEELGRRFSVTMFQPEDRVPDFKGG